MVQGPVILFPFRISYRKYLFCFLDRKSSPVIGLQQIIIFISYIIPVPVINRRTLLVNGILFSVKLCQSKGIQNRVHSFFKCFRLCVPGTGQIRRFCSRTNLSWTPGKNFPSLQHSSIFFSQKLHRPYIIAHFLLSIFIYSYLFYVCQSCISIYLSIPAEIFIKMIENRIRIHGCKRFCF